MTKDLLPIVCFGAIAVQVPTALHADGRWIEVGCHPQAVAQRTAWGKTIQTITPYKNRLYPTPGDRRHVFTVHSDYLRIADECER